VPVGGYANAFTGIPENWPEKTDPAPKRRDDLGPEAYAKWFASGSQTARGL